MITLLGGTPNCSLILVGALKVEATARPPRNARQIGSSSPKIRVKLKKIKTTIASDSLTLSIHVWYI